MYPVSADLGGPALIKRIRQRSVGAMLQTATDTKAGSELRPPSLEALYRWRICWAARGRGVNEQLVLLAGLTWRPRHLTAFRPLKVVPLESIGPVNINSRRVASLDRKCLLLQRD